MRPMADPAGFDDGVGVAAGVGRRRPTLRGERPQWLVEPLPHRSRARRTARGPLPARGGLRCAAVAAGRALGRSARRRPAGHGPHAGPGPARPAPPGDRHGGPTAHVSPTLNLTIAYFTSRGIGVVDVNYGGSSGYGRDYRERLRGQWGVVDVEDTVAAVHGLADAGLADRQRLAIEGGSAGGWTVLAALTETDAFACGASYFGVAELIKFVADTHDFESHYVDGLIGPLPEARGLYERRAPVNNVDKLSCPVLLLQGLDDPIVPPPQAEMFRDAMVSKGVAHAYLAYEGESHGFRRTETLINAREAELSFYGQAMGFEPPDVPRLELWRAQPRA